MKSPGFVSAPDQSGFAAVRHARLLGQRAVHSRSLLCARRVPNRQSSIVNRQFVRRRMASRISVVVTCHNYGRYLRECLESLLAQERPADEIVVVDDASTDDTPEVAAFYANQGV